MITVQLEIHGSMRYRAGAGSKSSVWLEDGTTVGALLEKIPGKGSRPGLLASVNGQQAEGQQVLGDGDVVVVITAMGGG